MYPRKLKAEEVATVFAYDPETRLLKPAFNAQKPFDISQVPLRGTQGFAYKLSRGSTRLEYLVDNAMYRGEDLSYALTYGMWPIGRLVPRDDNWHNLDPENWTLWNPHQTVNERGIYSKGPANYRVQVYDGKKAVYVGTFATLAEARAARDEAENLYAPARQRMARTWQPKKAGRSGPGADALFAEYARALEAKRAELDKLEDVLAWLKESTPGNSLPALPRSVEALLLPHRGLDAALAKIGFVAKSEPAPEPEKQAI